MILTKNGNLMKFASGAAVNAHIIDPYNPLGLPPFTIRIRFGLSHTPTMGDSQTRVPDTNDVWDITYNNTDWSNLLYSERVYVYEILGANTTGVTAMGRRFEVGLFKSCYNLTSIPLFDTRSVTSMAQMFYGASKLTSVPLFDTSACNTMQSLFEDCSKLEIVPLFNTTSCTDMQYMFRRCGALRQITLFDTTNVTNTYLMFQECYQVESGALALYQQMSTQANPPANHEACFRDCGRDTVTGAAELAQIPSSWK